VKEKKRKRRRTVVLVLNAEEVVKNAPRLVVTELVDASREGRVEVEGLETGDGVGAKREEGVSECMGAGGRGRSSPNDGVGSLAEKEVTKEDRRKGQFHKFDEKRGKRANENAPGKHLPGWPAIHEAQYGACSR
jgi:hypothetical protein